MSTRLRSIVRFPSLAPGVPTVLPHGLQVDGRAVIPDLLLPGVGNVTLTADATNVTATNTGTETLVNVDAWCDHTHTFLRAFGSINPVPGDPPEGSLVPQPFSPAFASASAGPTSDITVTQSTTLTTASGVAIDATFNTVSQVQGTFFSNAGGGIQVAANARVLFIWQLQWAADVGGTIRDVHLRRLSPAPADQAAGYLTLPPLGANVIEMTGSAMLEVSANDIMGVRVLQDSGSQLVADPILSAILIQDQ